MGILRGRDKHIVLAAGWNRFELFIRKRRANFGWMDQPVDMFCKMWCKRTAGEAYVEWFFIQTGRAKTGVL